MSAGSIHKTEVVDASSLKPHPRNYRTHPEDQLRHIGESLKKNGFYRNVVVAKDGTILAGHGVVAAAKLIGIEKIPVYRLNLDPLDPLALKVLTGDNELVRFAESDDRLLSELLKEIKAIDVDGLLGTGYDDQMLASLVMVTRPAHEIQSLDEAAEWLGMPAYEAGNNGFQLVVTFRTEAERDRFIEEKEMTVTKRLGRVWSSSWPFTVFEDTSSIRFEARK